MINDKWNLRHKAEIFFFVFKQMQTGDSWQETNQYRVSIYFAFAFIYIHINPRAYLYRMFRQYLNNGNSSSSFFSCTPSVNPLRQRPVPSVFCFFCMCEKREKNENRCGKMKSNNQCGCVWVACECVGDLERFPAKWRKALCPNAVQSISTPFSPDFRRQFPVYAAYFCGTL